MSMTDDQVRAELERIDPENHLRDMFLVLHDRKERDQGEPAAKVLDEKMLVALRLLAESQHTLRKIATGDVRNGWEMMELARNATGGK